MGSVAAVVLAAGEATRFGGPKQRLLLPEILGRVRRSPVDEILVVGGAYELEGVAEERTPPPVRVVRCPDWKLGPGASLRCGLAALDDDVDAAVVLLADGPRVSPAAIARVLDAWRGQGGIVAASYGGARGHPLVLGRDAWGAVPDGGLHDRSARLVPCDDLGAPGDVDRPEDLDPA